MSLEIRKLGDPVLREKCRDIEIVDSEVTGLIKDMEETLHLSPGRAGLAACQVGILKKLFIYDIGYGVRCIVNPDIIDKDEEVLKEEGCLSLPGVSVKVPRYERVKMRYATPSGHKLIIEAYGFLAQVFQHECDHLDGILIIDRCDKEERRAALAEYQELELKR